jgi:hypothetical protein
MSATAISTSTAHPLMAETLISVSEAARSIPAHRGTGRCNPATVWRWITEGVRSTSGERVRLESVRIGGRFVTSREALDRFIQRLSADAGVAAPAPRTPTQRQRSAKRADESLAKTGW